MRSIGREFLITPGVRHADKGDAAWTSATVLRGRGVTTRQIAVLVSLATIPTGSPVARGTLRYLAFCMGDMKIASATGVLEYTTPPAVGAVTRGRWQVCLVRRETNGTFRQVTAKAEVRNPRMLTFPLGSPIARIKNGSPVFVQIEYEAPSAIAGEPVFWASAPNFNVTINME